MYGWRRGFGAFSAPPSNIQTVLQNASASSGVPVSLLQAVAYQESSYNPNAVSGAGAQGLMQLMPGTAASLGVSNPFDAQQNADGGAKYLAQLYAQYGDWNTALIAYNEGPGNLAKSGPFVSSQDYASSILANADIPTGLPTLGPFVGPPVPTDSGDSGAAPSSSDFTASVNSGLAGIDPSVLIGVGLGLFGLILLVR